MQYSERVPSLSAQDLRDRAMVTAHLEGTVALTVRLVDGELEQLERMLAECASRDAATRTNSTIRRGRVIPIMRSKIMKLVNYILDRHPNQ